MEWVTVASGRSSDDWALLFSESLGGGALDGFPTAWDAWAFAVSTLMIDPLAGMEDGHKRWTHTPPELPLQPSLL